MSFRLLLISSMYKGYLDAFYDKHPEVFDLDYNQHYTLLIKDTTEFVASYVNHFNKLGIEASCVIANDKILQDKWKGSSGLVRLSGQDVLFHQVRYYRPDVLWIDDFHRVDNGLLSRIRTELPGIKLIMGYHCSPYDSAIIDKMKYTHFIISCTRGMMLEFEQNGLHSYHVYHGFDNEILSGIYRRERNTVPKFVFSGSLLHGRGSHNDRIRLIERIIEADIGLEVYLNLEPYLKIKAKQSVYIAGKILSILKMDSVKRRFPVLQYITSPVHDYSRQILKNSRKPLFGIDMYRLLSSSDLVLNIHGESTTMYCGNMRMFETTGAGSCLLTENKVNLKEIFEPGVEVVSYDNIDDCIEKAKYLLDNLKVCHEIAEAGQRRTLRDHTVMNRCLQISGIIRDELNRK